MDTFEELMSEVELEMKKISDRLEEEKKVIFHMCTEQNLTKFLKVVSQELDFLDLPTFNYNVNLDDTSSVKKLLVNVINSSYALIHLNRQNIGKLSDANFTKQKLMSDIKTLTKSNENLKRDLDDLVAECKTHKRRVCELEQEMREVKKTDSAIKCEVNLLKKQQKSQQSQYEHNIKRANSRSEILENKLRKNCGKYESRDEIVVHQFQELKDNQNLYKKVICKLEKQKQELLEEALSLKEDLAVALCHKSKD